jgi:hypothetical protein
MACRKKLKMQTKKCEVHICKRPGTHPGKHRCHCGVQWMYVPRPGANEALNSFDPVRVFSTETPKGDGLN